MFAAKHDGSSDASTPCSSLHRHSLGPSLLHQPSVTTRWNRLVFMRFPGLRCQMRHGPEVGCADGPDVATERLVPAGSGLVE